MGLGGYLTWTSAARELVGAARLAGRPGVKVYPFDNTAGVAKLVKSEIFFNNPYFYQDGELDEDNIIGLWLNNPSTLYCKGDTPERAIHRYDKHIIEQICEAYNIDNPKLKCELFFTEQEVENASKVLIENSINGDFVVIEPASKDSYTVNRAYPFYKWQYVADRLSKETQVVQIGASDSPVLNSVINLTGQTTFREACAVIKESKGFISSEGGLVHGATAVDTQSVVVLTGYQSPRMVAYPQNININIAGHGPCGLKIECSECSKDAAAHDPEEIVEAVKNLL
jgi:ADP-heptose:LPS heptosyltransferase